MTDIKNYRLELEYDSAQVLLMAECQTKDPNYPYYEEVLANLVNKHQGVIKPQAYRIISDESLPETEGFNRYALCLVTLGDGLDHAISKAFAEHEYLEGMLLNALGDEIITRASNQLYVLLKDELKEESLYLTKRHEPGNSKVPMSFQKTIYDKMTEAFEVSLSITEGFMFSPSKTLGYYYGIEEENCSDGIDHDCSDCSAYDCRHRLFKVRIHKGEELITLQAKRGTDLLEFLRSHGYPIEAPCSGSGRCGKCKVKLLEQRYTIDSREASFLSEADKRDGIILACYHEIDRDIDVVQKLEAVETEIEGDYMSFQISSPKGKILPLVLKEFGIAVDIGTTTLVVSLIDLATQKTIGTKKTLNPQKAYGADVISRILYVTEHRNGVLGRVIREKIEALILELLQEADKHETDIKEIVISGNTTMIYRLLDMDPSAIAVSPFETVDMGVKECKAAEIFTEHVTAEVTLLPYRSAYVGGDIISGLYAYDIAFKKENILYVDIGTNGEMVLKTPNRLISAATAAGPAFEGANIKNGMGSVSGAICEVALSEEGYSIKTLGSAEPIGLCGSAIVDVTAVLMEQGFIENTGYMQDRVNISGDIWFYPEDVRQVQLAKGAITAGIDVLLMEAGLTYQDIDAFYIAGGFGSHLNIKNSSAIGLIPKALADRIVLVGNASLAGAVRFILEKEGLAQVKALVEQCEYLELSSDLRFNEFFIENMMIGEK